MRSQTVSMAYSTAVASWAPYETRYGAGWIGWTDDGTIEHLVLPGLPRPAGDASTGGSDVAQLARTLADYFNGVGECPPGDGFIRRASASSLDEAIYAVVTGIRTGSTMTYSEVAAEVHRPRAARAVGAAMARNRFAPMIPCHRVLGFDGALRGYAGGLEMKRALLDMEATSG